MNLGPDDLDIRYWDYDTWKPIEGLILRRIDGEWSAWALPREGSYHNDMCPILEPEIGWEAYWQLILDAGLADIEDPYPSKAGLQYVLDGGYTMVEANIGGRYRAFAYMYPTERTPLEDQLNAIAGHLNDLWILRRCSRNSLIHFGRSWLLHQKFDAAQNVIGEGVVREEPEAYWEATWLSERGNIRRFERANRLKPASELALPPDDLSIHFWFDNGSGQIEGITLDRREGHWQVFHIPLANPRVQNGRVNRHPRQGWAEFWSKLQDLGIETFDDTSLGAEYLGGTGDLLIVEINHGGRYKARVGELHETNETLYPIFSHVWELTK